MTAEFIRILARIIEINYFLKILKQKIFENFTYFCSILQKNLSLADFYLGLQMIAKQKNHLGANVIQTFGVQTLDFMKTEIAIFSENYDFLVKIAIFDQNYGLRAKCPFLIKVW